MLVSAVWRNEPAICTHICPSSWTSSPSHLSKSPQRGPPLSEHFYAAAKSLQSCPTLCDPIGSSPQGSPVPGVLQAPTEHWSGLPFPSPMHEREKWKWSHSVVSNSSRPHGSQPTRLIRPWDFPGKSTGVGCLCLLREHFYKGSLICSGLA